jgi:hypothetical protein
MFLSLTLLIFVWKFKSLQVEIINISFVKIVEDALFIMIIIIFSFYKPIYGALFFSFFFFLFFLGRPRPYLFIFIFSFLTNQPYGGLLPPEALGDRVSHLVEERALMTCCNPFHHLVLS